MTPPPPDAPEQVVDGGGSSVDAPQHVSGASLQMPAQRQAVQVGEQTHLQVQEVLESHQLFHGRTAEANG